MQRLFYLLVFSFFFISSCKKEYPDPSGETPVFYAKGVINGNAVNIQAGVNDYYMFTSFVQDSNNVYNFLGSLKQTICTSCTNSLQFQINDRKVSSINSPVADSSLLPGHYTFQIPGGISVQYPVDFIAIPDPNDTALSYSWNFGDNYTSALDNPLHSYSAPGAYNVCLNITYASGCSSSICKKINVGSSVSSSCNVNITGNTMISPGDSTTLTASFFPACTNATYSWNGNGLTGNANSIMVQPLSTTQYQVIACCSNGSSCCDTASVTVVVAQVPSCIANFDFHVDSTNVTGPSNPYALTAATLTWIDNSGIVYTSNNANQSPNSYFQIVSVENYLNNQLGQRTKKLHAKFTCKLFSSNGTNSVQIDNGEAVIAVAYK